MNKKQHVKYISAIVFLTCFDWISKNSYKLLYYNDNHMYNEEVDNNEFEKSNCGGTVTFTYPFLFLLLFKYGLSILQGQNFNFQEQLEPEKTSEMNSNFCHNYENLKMQKLGSMELLYAIDKCDYNKYNNIRS
eukprot:Pgem_evm1s12423